MGPLLAPLLFTFALAPAARAATRSVSPEEMLELIRRSRVWHPVDIEREDVYKGPEGPGALPPGGELDCKYKEQDRRNPIAGHSKKFYCVEADGAADKIKYDAAKEPKVYGSPAGTRLFWMLGFYAERVYSVKTVCSNCPPDPWTGDGPRATRVFDPSAVERRLPGTHIEYAPEEAWNLDQLDFIDEAAGGAPRAQVDALKLLIVFANHGDDNDTQQVLLCEPGDDACKRPVMYVTDLGSTFGGREYFASYRGWDKLGSIWKDKAKCVAKFTGSYPGFKDPVISEAGRKFLADLLARVSDKQLRDLFASARMDVLARYDPPFIDARGRSRPVRIDDWVALFKKRRQEILDARCPR